MFWYKIPSPDEALLITGGKGMKVIIGRGAWVLPFFRKTRSLSLSQRKVEISEHCRTSEFLTLNIEAVVAFKVAPDEGAIKLAGERYISQQKEQELMQLAQDAFTGHLRAIVAKMTAKQVSSDREKLMDEVLSTSQNEVSNWGLRVDTIQIKSIDDLNTGYFESLAAPERAVVEQNAKIAQAQAAQLAQAAEQESMRKQAEQERNTATTKAQYKSEMDKANADAEAAGQLAKADVERRVLEQQQLVADTNAELIQRQLVADRIKPAEAEARRIRIEADAQTSASEAAAKRAQFEADAQKTRQIRAAEAQAQQTRLAAEANAAQVKLQAEAARDAATFNAEATQAQGKAEAAATEARGLAEAKTIEARGLAEAKGQLEKAKALASNNNAQIELERVRMVPQVAEALRPQLPDNSQLYMLNGAQGWEQIMGMALPLIQQVLSTFTNKNGQPATSSTDDGFGPLTPGITSVAGAEKQLADAKSNGV